MNKSRRVGLIVENASERLDERASPASFNQKPRANLLGVVLKPLEVIGEAMSIEPLEAEVPKLVHERGIP